MPRSFQFARYLGDRIAEIDQVYIDRPLNQVFVGRHRQLLIIYVRPRPTKICEIWKIGGDEMLILLYTKLHYLY